MLSCVSRPRRFGKSYAANMLEAYYDCNSSLDGLHDDVRLIAITYDWYDKTKAYHCRIERA